MHNPAHPGELLRDWIPEQMTVTDAAEQLGVSRVRLQSLLNGKTGVTADLALRLAAWLGTTPEVWIFTQAAWDLWQAKQRGLPDVKPLRLAP